MKALVWEAPRAMALRQEARPAPGPEDVLVRVAFAGICGSELGGYLGHNALRVPPLVMGHEFAGEVAALGENAASRRPGLAEGQAVTVNPMVWCGACRYCQAGQHHLCLNRRLIGAHRPGAYAEYVVVPAETVSPLPEGMPARTGAMVEPVAVAVRIGQTAGRLDGEDALVIGAGPIGLLALQALRLNGAGRVFIADLDAARLGMGAALGGVPLDPRAVEVDKAVREATGGLGVPLAVDAVGTAATRKQCIAAARSAGRVILSGLHEETGPVPVADAIRREITLQGCFCYTHANFAEAIARLADGRMTLEPWVVEAPLADGGQWFDRLIEEPGGIAKVLLVP
jgi:threonine dehydrogenase-like Zn-dependent dehydrogenase